MQGLLIDVSRLFRRACRQQSPTGIDRVLLAYLQHYKQRAQLLLRFGQFAFILSEQASRQASSLLLSWHPKIFWPFIGLLIKDSFRSEAKQSLKNIILLKIDYSGLHYEGLYHTLKRHGMKLIFMVHDLIPFENPEFFPTTKAQKYQRILSFIMNNATGIVTNSQTTTNSLINHIPNLKLLPYLISASLAPGITSSTPPRQERPIKENYFLIVGTIQRRKNHLFLLKLWLKLIERHGIDTPKLVLIGERGYLCKQTLALLDNCDLIKKFIIEHPANDEDLLTYLHHAQALLLPSLAEGYGLPLIEALSAGTPVIANNLSVFHEIAGDIPDFIPVQNAQQWLACIENYMLANSTLRAIQLQRISQFSIPNWQTHFIKVEPFLHMLRALDPT
ncbi:glycosyltransferase family 4 protein [Legionella cardiaca]|uniref:Glycosyltransferase family 1 protein n=1 Tax=Legionella cardiaca TaxID=1071983 RepID=A0ABY8AUK7_9GAMM|nr:glycosyltransferase family 1 protein [Legionella cardiaca]WED42817.1 glycosyltransferase family 1 protein [Legionella cardiaca]